MNSSMLLSVVLFIYGFAVILYIFSLVFSKEMPGKFASYVSIIGATGNLAGIIMRWLESYQKGFGHIPLSNLYESLIFFAFVISVLYLVIELKYKNRIISCFASPLALIAMGYASLPSVSNKIQPLVPALKSNWLTIHVITCFLGYAGFAVSFGLSIMYVSIFKKNYFFNKFPSDHILNELNYQLVMFGFLFLTIGIITGAVWANSAWGRYWSWDPKETWSLITWLVYCFFLHARFMKGWHGKRLAWISIIGFIAVLFTYFGVNFLLSGLHSYGN